MSRDDFTIRGTDYLWRPPTAADLAEWEREMGQPLTDQTALRSVHGRGYLLWLLFRRDQPDLTLDRVLAWGPSLIASPNISRLLDKACPQLGIEEPRPDSRRMYGRQTTKRQEGLATNRSSGVDRLLDIEGPAR